MVDFPYYLSITCDFSEVGSLLYIHLQKTYDFSEVV